MPRTTWRSLVAAASGASLLLAPLAYAQPAVTTVHVVAPGETLSQIAADAGVDEAALASLNALDDANILRIGQSLSLPPSSASAAAVSPAAAVAAAGSANGYTVADGDTLWSIAQRFSTSTAALADANHLDDPDHVAVGTQLALPRGAVAALSSPAPSPTPTASPKPASTQPAATLSSAKRSLLVSYTVQSGETLGQIARQFDVSAEAIAQASGLEDANRLSVGAVLKVPLPGREHTVVAGETLRDIAAQEKIDLGSLIDFNALDDPALIRVGQVVLVPSAAGLQSAAASAPPTAPATLKPTPSPTPATSAANTTSAGPAATATQATPKPKATASPVAAAAAGGAASASVSGDSLAGAGLKLLGAPYVWGGSSPAGFDCSGFVWYVARQIGKPLSRGLFGEYNSGSHPSRDELKPGDLLFFQNTYSAGLSHNGIYLGNNQFIHAADETAGVTVSNLGTAYWSSHWFGATRLP